MDQGKIKSFWSRPEGITGAIFLGVAAIGLIYLFATTVSIGLWLLTSTAGQLTLLLSLGTLVFLAIDGTSRALASYIFKSAMRWITNFFVQTDPIGVLKNYVRSLQENLRKMNRQIAKLRGQMHRLKEMIINNRKEIEDNMAFAQEAKQNNQTAQVVLKSRKAGRLQESNLKLEDFYKKMEILYRILAKMYENTSILAEDIEDQVKIKEQERIALTAGHSAMQAAMKVIRGDKDQKELFDMALEAMAEDVSGKVGELERFMSISENFMQSIDLQNGIFEEEGLKMLEKWESEGISLILGSDKEKIIAQTWTDEEILDLKHPAPEAQQTAKSTNQYDSFFD